MEINRKDIVRNDFVPNGIYTCLITKVDNTPAGTGTVQTRLDLQIVAPETAVLGGQQFAVAGKNLNDRIFFSEKSMGRALETVRSIGLTDAADNAATTDDIQAALANLENCYIDVVIESRERLVRATPEPGQPAYKAPVLKRADGSPVTDGYEISVKCYERHTLRKPDGQPY